MWFVLWNLSTISHRASSLVTLLPTTSHVSNVAIVMVFNGSQIYRLINLQPNCKKWSNGTGFICYFWVISQYYLDALWWRPTENRTQEHNSKVCSLLGTHDPSSYYHETTCELLNENHASARFCFHVRRHFCQFSSILALYCHSVFGDD